MRVPTTSIAPLTRRDAAVGVALVAISLRLAVGSPFVHPHPALNVDYLFGDEGHNLLVADTLLSGGRLYRDVFSQYGPIPAYLHALFARILGNTPFAYLSYLALVSDQHLRTVIIVGMPNLGMPDWRSHRKPLTDAAVGDLVAWLASQREPLSARLNQ